MVHSDQLMGWISSTNCITADLNSASKAAIIRATTSFQAELDLEGKTGVSLFSLHPGGVKTTMNEGINHD